MILSFLQQTLTFFTAPRKRAFLASQAKQILNNRQPEQQIEEIPTVEEIRERRLPIMNVKTQDLPPKRAGSSRGSVSPGRDTGFPEPLSPGLWFFFFALFLDFGWWGAGRVEGKQ